jgi:hypothetical protein
MFSELTNNERKEEKVPGGQGKGVKDTGNLAATY